mgnify:CR=1 FL=1
MSTSRPQTFSIQFMTLSSSASLGSRTLEVSADAEGNVVQRDRQSGESEGIWHGTCWRQRAGAVIPCTRRRAGLLEAMALAHPATVLLPLQGDGWQLRSAGVSTADGRLMDTLTFASKTSSEAALAIDPETGRVRWLQVEETRITFADVQPRGEAQLPVQRTLRTQPVECRVHPCTCHRSTIGRCRLAVNAQSSRTVRARRRDPS